MAEGAFWFMYKATHTQAPDFAYALCAARMETALKGGWILPSEFDLSSLRHVLNGAERISGKSIASFSAAFQGSGFKRDAFMPAYGLAEHTVYVCDKGRGTLVLDAHLLEADGRARIVATEGLGCDDVAVTSEVAYSTARSPDGRRTRALMSCGTPPPEVHLVVVDPHRCQPCVDGVVGEVWLHSASCAAGYWQQPELSQRTFHAQLKPIGSPDDGGDSDEDNMECMSGDLGFIWKGQVYITGRCKDLIVLHGRNVAPEDVELCVQDACSDVRPGCLAAFAVHSEGGQVRAGTCEEPSGEEAEVVLLAEVRDTGISRDAARRLAQGIRAAVSRDQNIQLCAVCLLLPRTICKTSSGKVRRFECKQQFLAQELQTLFVDAPIPQHPQTIAGLNNELQHDECSDGEACPLLDPGRGALITMPSSRRVRTLERQLLQYMRIKWLPKVSMRESFFAAGLDSTAMIQFHGVLEHVYAVSLPPALLLDAHSIHKVARALSEALELHVGTDGPAMAKPLATAKVAEPAASKYRDAPECSEVPELSSLTTNSHDAVATTAEGLRRRFDSSSKGSGAHESAVYDKSDRKDTAADSFYKIDDVDGRNLRQTGRDVGPQSDQRENVRLSAVVDGDDFEQDGGTMMDDDDVSGAAHTNRLRKDEHLGEMQRLGLLGIVVMILTAATLCAWSMHTRLDTAGQPLSWWSQPEWLFCPPGLQPGWLAGRKMDMSHWR
ncbi:hypothetical protein CYMTET_14041 [Cymbomonas tetramitiformis]|uniref:Carrier domain-containing protein n=1 Tax=Cymbomonas tetramitiformis TaxID=36881 RepID=A0AAE0GH86_9CHLO|nr:hypothetical protein CYMTET_14041 [Cymbomonas tetramitiformis]